MPDAATVSAWASVIAAIGTLVVAGCVLRLLKIQGQYNRLLRDTLDVYDPVKVNERMRAIKEQAELAAEATVKDLRAKLEARADFAVNVADELTTNYADAIVWLALMLYYYPAARMSFESSDWTPQSLKDRVRAASAVLDKKFDPVTSKARGFVGAASRATLPPLPPDTK
jgi:hypothetical protein